MQTRSRSGARSRAAGRWNDDHQLRSRSRRRRRRRRGTGKHARHEVRRHVGGRHAEDQGSRAPACHRPRGRAARRRRPVGDGRHDRRPDPARTRDVAQTSSPRVRHARVGRRAHLECALRDGHPGPRPRSRLAHRLAGGNRHRHVPRQGEDRRSARTAAPRRARPRPDRAGRRLPGRVDRTRGDDARPWRLRRDCGRAGVCAGRGVRDLHGRRRRVHGRPPRRRRRFEAPEGLVRRDARDGRDRRTSDDGAVDRDRTQVRCAAPRALSVRRKRGDVDHERGEPGAREGDHLRSHPRHLGGEGDRARGARPSGNRRAHLPRARRRRGEHRHDRAERLGGRSDRHLVHAAEDGPPRGGADSRGPRVGDRCEGRRLRP